MQLLHDAVPTAKHVALLARRSQRSEGPAVLAAREAAAQLGIALVPALYDPPVSEATYRRIFDSLANQRIDAIFVHGSRQNKDFMATIIPLVQEARLPAIYDIKRATELGGLVSYGPDRPANYRRAAYYIDCILSGADPAEMPIEQPMNFDFVINLKTARELGFEFPLKFLLGATEVIE